MLSSLEEMPDALLPLVLARLQLRDLAALGACSRALRSALQQQPEAVWHAAAQSDPAYPRHASILCGRTRLPFPDLLPP